MIKCVGSEIYLNGKCVGTIEEQVVGGFFAKFKAGRRLWVDAMSGKGAFQSLEEAQLTIEDAQHRERIILAAFTGNLPVTPVATFVATPAINMNHAAIIHQHEIPTQVALY